ncbi:hypothetical protein HU200_048835 [Digitaria exilis]|uniref:Protein kinase domain-containing protein n=1 Tax=Digitaria exilis TaxID=1010633 RepID=A0A835E7B5_9POAL|nr:hypothetical protein HU200_048835 [Digitaria exilis]
MDKKESGIEELESVFTYESSQTIRISYSAIKFITKKFCQVIGRGGYGTVYLGSLRNNVMVAVKKLDTSRNFSDEKFLGELKCLKTVNHKNIVRFLGYCACTDGEVMEIQGKDTVADELRRFLCFEYAPNGNLHDYLKEKPPGYEWSIRYKIIKGICQGLDYLHGKGIKHLDLKPENVLLGAEMEPKITDFGLSRNDGTQSTIVINNTLGTPGYIAPEMIDGHKISFKSDIYSLGIIMKRLLMGTHEYIPQNVRRIYLYFLKPVFIISSI